jgi:hypothetical protein
MILRIHLRFKLHYHNIHLMIITNYLHEPKIIIDRFQLGYTYNVENDKNKLNIFRFAEGIHQVNYFFLK